MMYDEFKIFSVDSSFYGNNGSQNDLYDLTEKINEKIDDWIRQKKINKDKIELIKTETQCGSYKAEGKDIVFMTCTVHYKKEYL